MTVSTVDESIKSIQNSSYLPVNQLKFQSQLYIFSDVITLAKWEIIKKLFISPIGIDFDFDFYVQSFLKTIIIDIFEHPL